MHGTLRNQIETARETERRIRQGTDKIVSVGKFGIVAKALWPVKTAAQLAAISKRDERTAARWLSGEFEPPYPVIEAVMHEIFWRG
jgi:hypothetical protein